MGRRLLVIDDDPNIRKLVRCHLEPEGWTVEEAGTGQAGVERAKAAAPDAILLDYQLPDGDGPEFCKRLKANPGLARVPVVMISGLRTNVGDRVEGLDQGAVDYLVKPFKMAVLSAKLEALLR
ncbi:MAG: response regulator transcription factor [Elusimicrobia bacterium]|nr:response regulator transcription factor [Elusimicrobiota bacterium]